MSLTRTVTAYPAGKVVAGFDKRFLDRTFRLSQVLLHQVHDRCCYESEGRSSADEHLLIYMLSGNADVAVEGKLVHLPHRQLIWIKPCYSYQITAAEKSNKAIRFVTVEMSPVGKQGLEAVFRAGDGHQVICDTAGMDELFFELINELQIQDHYTQTMLDSLLNRIIVQAGRLLEGVGSPPKGIEKTFNKKELLYQTVQYIDQHIEKIDELGQVAEVLGYSYSYLSHVFRAEMSVSLQAYWVQRRMMRAMSRLQSGRSSITQISEDLHYQSIHSFSKAFKKVTSFTPTEYQSLYGKGRSNE
ncbi:helix-turn-helix domain-containing protein [Paenibacillus sp. FA6]|uniref:helix-turn-helix domain-containing protein n=1 Tax=Paenibacillus sp. FA6 TaxID=3413029 RepID=UPI003F657E1B